MNARQRDLFLWQWSKRRRVENDRLGESVAGVGDVNGDGIDDLLIGRVEATSSLTLGASESGDNLT